MLQTEASSRGFRQPEGFQRTPRQKIDAYLDRIDAVNGSHRFKKLAVGATEPPAPQGAAGSITQLDVFCHQRYLPENLSTACLRRNEMPVLEKLQERSWNTLPVSAKSSRAKGMDVGRPTSDESIHSFSDERFFDCNGACPVTGIPPTPSADHPVIRSVRLVPCSVRTGMCGE